MKWWCCSWRWWRRRLRRQRRRRRQSSFDIERVVWWVTMMMMVGRGFADFFLWIQKLCVYEGLKGNLNVQHRFGVLNNFQMIPLPLPARGTGTTTACSRQTASQSVIQPKLPTNQTNKHAAIYSFSQPVSQLTYQATQPGRRVAKVICIWEIVWNAMDRRLDGLKTKLIKK